MRTYSLFLFFIAATFLVSCYKEDTYPPVGTYGVRLVKSVAVENGETITTTYAYAADGKIDVINMTGISGGLDAGNYRRFYRDDKGRIVKIAEKIPPQSGEEIDTVFTNVHYPDAATFNYDYTVMKITVSGFEILDSIRYTYNSNNQVTEGYSYQSSPIFGPVQESRFVYNYDAAGNIIKITGYNDASGTMELSVTLDLEYDDKKNPLAFDKQIMLITGGSPGSSGNNVTVAKFKDVNNPEVQTITNTYTYGTNNLPQTLVSQDDFDGAITTTTTTFYYE